MSNESSNKSTSNQSQTGQTTEKPKPSATDLDVTIRKGKNPTIERKDKVDKRKEEKGK